MMHPIVNRTALLLDPWSSEYLASVQTEGIEEEQTPVEVDASVETDRWEPRPAGAPPETAWFVDGVRRLEARVVGWPGGAIVHGLFASFATGAVIVSEGRATFEHCAVERRFILTAGLAQVESLNVGGLKLTFEALSAAAGTPADLVLALQNAMRNSEAALASSCECGIVFLDGPLAFLTEPRGPVVGVVKTIHRLYLDPEHMELVFRLRTGERTPLFTIREGSKARYSWYLRIGEPRPTHHGLSGIVRLETGASAGVAQAVSLASASAGYLPRFASTPARDRRAPQNLTPVGALEEHLRNRMGDATLIQRAIERRVSEGLTI